MTDFLLPLAGSAAGLVAGLIEVVDFALVVAGVVVDFMTGSVVVVDSLVVVDFMLVLTGVVVDLITGLTEMADFLLPLANNEVGLVASLIEAVDFVFGVAGVVVDFVPGLMAVVDFFLGVARGVVDLVAGSEAIIFSRVCLLNAGRVCSIAGVWVGVVLAVGRVFSVMDRGSVVVALMVVVASEEVGFVVAKTVVTLTIEGVELLVIWRLGVVTFVVVLTGIDV